MLETDKIKYMNQYSLDKRSELSSDLMFLFSEYPKSSWESHPNLTGLLRFWLSKHNEFNQFFAELNAGNDLLLARDLTPQQFQSIMVPKIRWLLNEFHEHHYIEDNFTFPALRKAEPKLIHGFDVLDADHKVLNQGLQQLTQVTNDIIQCGQHVVPPKIVESFIQTTAGLTKNLKQHLLDEEEIVIPLFLDRGEKIINLG